MANKDKKLWDYHQNENRFHLKNWYPRQDLIFKFIKKNIYKWWRILEIGFWDWYLLNKLSNYWYNVFWQDLSDINIKNTKEQWNNKNIIFLLWDDTWKLLIEDESIDWFVASEVLEHMSDEELNYNIKEIYRVLKKWWYAFITFPAKENLKSNECICSNCWEVFHKWWHKQYWDEKKILNTFKEFNIIYSKEFFNRYTWKTILENIIWWIMFVLRNILNKFINIENKSYLVILKKLK